MKIGLLGGTFDPVHKGHLALAQAAVSQLRLSRLYFVLSPKSPFKSKKKLTPSSLRLSMLRWAVKGNNKFSVGLWEMKRRGLSYTITTVKAVKKRHPKYDLHLILGSDAFAGFPKWKISEEIGKRATLVVGLRPGTKYSKTIKTKVPSLFVLKGRFPAISSTDIRENVKRGKMGLSQVVPPVRKFIQKHNLYAKD